MPWLGTVGPVLTAADAAAVVAAGLMAGDGSLATIGIAAAIAVLVARTADLHRPRLVLSIVEELPGLFVAAVAATLVVGVTNPERLRFGPLTFASLVLAHTLVHAGRHLLRRHGGLGRRTLVVGTGAEARRLAIALLTRPELGLRPVGFVGTGTGGVRQARGLPLALLGPVDWLPRVMAETAVDTVVVALGAPAGAEETAALEGLLATPTEVYAVPGWFPPGLASSRHPRELVDDIPVVRLHPRPPWPPVRALKRLVEVLAALATLVALLPLFVALAVLVKIETGGVLVRRSRVLGDGRPTSAPSFRTRRSRSVGRPGTTFSVAISGRVGPVGRLLRRTRLVRLPEVLRGLLRRLRYAGGAPADEPRTALPDPPRTDEAKVDAGQLAR